MIDNCDPGGSELPLPTTYTDDLPCVELAVREAQENARYLTREAAVLAKRKERSK